MSELNEQITNQHIHDVFAYLTDETVRLRESGQLRLSEICMSSLSRLKDFRKGETIAFKDFDGSFIESFEKYLENRSLSKNTIGFYMRALRSLYHKAVSRGLTEDQTPFKNVYTGKARTVKQAVTAKAIKAIRGLNLENQPSLDFARDMFLFSFYACGMPFQDMAHLLRDSIHDDLLVYYSIKNNDQQVVEWLPQMQAIVEKYRDVSAANRLLPIITDEQGDQRRQCKNQLQNINRNLKEVAYLAHVQSPLSMSAARHTWASIAQKSHMPLSVIKSNIGERSDTAALAYLGSIKQSEVSKPKKRVGK